MVLKKKKKTILVYEFKGEIKKTTLTHVVQRFFSFFFFFFRIRIIIN